MIPAPPFKKAQLVLPDGSVQKLIFNIFMNLHPNSTAIINIIIIIIIIIIFHQIWWIVMALRASATFRSKLMTALLLWSPASCIWVTLLSQCDWPWLGLAGVAELSRFSVIFTDGSPSHQRVFPRNVQNSKSRRFWKKESVIYSDLIVINGD